MASIAELSVSINADTTGLQKGQAETKAILGNIGAQFTAMPKTTGTAVQGMMGQFGKLAVQLVGLSSILNVFKQGLNFNKEMETAKVAFGVMIGSTQKADSLIKQLQETAKKTPMAFGELQAAAKNLLAFGIGADDINKNLIMIGNIASGIGAPVEDLAAIFGKIKTSGRVMADDLNQLGGRGIPVISELAKVMGIAETEVRKMSEQGKIGFPEIEKAFQNMTGEGGKFAGMMEKQSATFAGMLSTMQDTLTQFAGKMTESLITPMKMGMTLIDGLNNLFGMLPGPIQTVIASFAALGLAVGAVILGAQMLGVALPAAFGPWGVAIAGAIALILGVVAAFEEMADKSKKSAEVMGTDFRTNTKDIKELDAALKIVNDNIQTNENSQKAAASARYRDQERINALNKEAIELQDKKNQIVNAMKSSTQTTVAKTEIKQSEDKNLEVLQEKQKQAEIDAVKETAAAKEKARLDKIEMDKKIAADKWLADSTALQREVREAEEKRISDVADYETKMRDNRLEEEKKANDELTSISIASANKTKQTIDTIMGLVNSNSDDLGRNILTAIGGAMLACIPMAGALGVAIGVAAAPLTIIAAIIASVTFSVVAVIDLIQRAEKDAQKMAQLSTDIALSVISNKEKIEKAALDTTLKNLEKERQARMKAAGIVVKTEKDVQKERMKNLEEQLQAATDATDEESAAKIRATIAEQRINDEFDEKMQKAEEESAARMRQYAYDKAVVEKKVALATAEINRSKQKSETLPWDWKMRDSIDALFNTLVGSIQSIPLPALANGTNFATGGATLVGERGPEIVNIPKGASVLPAHESKGMSGKGNNTFIFNSPMALNPSQAAEAMRNSMRQLSFQGAF